jgi:hypothetical protein
LKQVNLSRIAIHINIFLFHQKKKDLLTDNEFNSLIEDASVNIKENQEIDPGMAFFI